MASYKYLFLLPLTTSTAWAIPVSVQINDSAGKPVAGVLVEAQTFGPTGLSLQAKTTGVTGQVAFEATPLPNQPDYLGRFNAWKKGYGLAGGPLRRGGVKVGLTRGASLSGSVVDTAQKPLGNVTVSLGTARQADGTTIYYGGPKRQSQLNSHLEARTDAQGRFQVGDLPTNGQIQLVINDPRFVRATVDGRTDGAVQFALRPSATLKGTLLDAMGKPLAKANLYAFGQGEAESIRADAVTDGQGNYVFSSLPNGLYSVRLALDNQLNLVVVPVTAKAVEGQITEVLPLRAQTGVLVGGLVCNKITRQPIPGALVQIVSPSNLENYAFTDAKGHWQAHVLPGTIKASVEQPPKEFLRMGDQSRSVAVPATGVQGINFELTPTTKIIGRVVNEKGEGVKAALMLTQGYQEWPLQSDERGDFAVYGPNKGYVTVALSTWNWQEEDSRWQVVRAEKLTLPTSKPLTVVVRPMALNRVEGGVVDEDGKPVSGAEVTLRIKTGSADQELTTPVKVSSGAQGHFRYEKLRPDQKVEVSASKEHYDFVRGGGTTKKGSQWIVTPLVLRQRNGRIAGRVLNSQGQGIEGAQVFAAGVETRSLANGDFALENLPTAEVDVVAYGDEEFALVKGAAKGAVEMRLAPVTLQKQDVGLATQILDEARTEAQDTKYYAKDALERVSE